MQLVVFDTEFTAWEGSQERGWSEDWEHRELVQIGAVRVDFDLPEGKIVKAELDILTQPILNSRLSGYFSDLTGITQDMLAERGILAAEGVEKFAAFCAGLAAVSNGGDEKIFAEIAQLQGFERQDAAVRYGNLHEVMWGGLEKVLGYAPDRGGYPSGRVYELLDIEMDGQVHNALHDVKSLAFTLHKLMNLNALDERDIAGWGAVNRDDGNL